MCFGAHEVASSGSWGAEEEHAREAHMRDFVPELLALVCPAEYERCLDNGGCKQSLQVIMNVTQIDEAAVTVRSPSLIS